MSAFANATDAMDFHESYCVRCVNWRAQKWLPDGVEICPVWDLHGFLSGGPVTTAGAMDSQEAREVGQFVSDFLIPNTADGPRCSMFVERGDTETLDLFARTAP